MSGEPQIGGLLDRLAIARFTNIGFKLNARSFAEPLDDMTGKTVVVTGATGGIGYAAAKRLAGLGAHVVVVGRSEPKLDAVTSELGGDVRGLQADLSLMADIRALAETLLETEARIDVLINNVGVLLPERRLTSEGLEMSFATNLAGHFLLTNLLLPRLIELAPARIVNVTSGGMYSAKIRPDDLQFEQREYSGTAAYASDKRGQVVLTEMWAERLAGTGVVCHVAHPGWAKTAGVQQSLPTFDKVMRPFLRTPEQGADTLVWLAAAGSPATTSGDFWFDREIAPTHMTASTVETADDRRDLWETLVAVTGSDVELTASSQP
jgi:NAD(P)-dependent dehydrogenase (short-subunit alcohol dehydrogenase family)